jgi:LmbE family N-acetylglucosaminyl deacetylase
MMIIDQPWFVHLMSDFFSISVLAYIFIRRNEIIRSTQNISRVYRLIIGISILLFILNTFRLIIEARPASENSFTSMIDIFSDYGNLVGQSLIILYLLNSKIVIERQPTPGRILVIGAHPDDIEIAAGASIAKMHDAGYKIYGLVLSHGERGGNGESRLSEAKNGARFLELDDLCVLDFTDTRMLAETADIVIAIENIIDQYNPDMIFTHSKHDLHQDHQVVHECTLRAVRSLRISVLCYESPSVTQEFLPVYYLDVCGYVDIKIHSIEKHWDQKKKPYMREELIRSKLAFRGNQAKVDYAEGFEVVRMISRI